MSRLEIDKGYEIETIDGSRGIVLGVIENWILTVLETGGKPVAIWRADICSAERPKNDAKELIA